MIVGAHSILYSTDAEGDRAFLRDVLGFPSVDVGEGWLIFGLPPAEVAVHPGDENDVHELYLMCDDVAGFVDSMRKQDVACGAVMNRGWGLLTEVTLPGGGKLGVYQPRHARPPQPMGTTGGKTSARRMKTASGQKPRRKRAAARRRPAARAAGRRR